MRKIPAIAFCVVLFFTTGSSVVAQTVACPWIKWPHSQQTQGCPDLFKSQWTPMVWAYMEIDEQTFGRGQCGAGLQCWPQFEQPFKRVSHRDATTEYSFVVHIVKEMAVFYPQFEEPGCGVYAVREFIPLRMVFQDNAEDLAPALDGQTS